MPLRKILYTECIIETYLKRQVRWRNVHKTFDTVAPHTSFVCRRGWP